MPFSFKSLSAMIGNGITFSPGLFIYFFKRYITLCTLDSSICRLRIYLLKTQLQNTSHSMESVSMGNIALHLASWPQ